MPINRKLKRNIWTIRFITISVLFMGLNVTGLISAVIPRTKNTLNMLDPTIFPTAMLVCHLVTATIDVASSGKDVPIASMVSPISFSLHHRIVASWTAFSTTRFPPKVNQMIPHRTNSADFG